MNRALLQSERTSISRRIKELGNSHEDGVMRMRLNNLLRYDFERSMFACSASFSKSKELSCRVRAEQEQKRHDAQEVEQNQGE